MSEESDLTRQLTETRDRLLREKNELRASLEELLTKPACNSCIYHAQMVLARIPFE